MTDVSFLASMQFQTDCNSASESIYTSLATLLSKTPLLSELHVAVRDTMSWNAFPLVHAHGVSIDRALRQSLHRLPQFSLPRLTCLHLDGIEGLGSLLSLAPNLQSLSLSLSAGYALSVNQDLVQVLELVPKLRKLAYTPDTLRLEPAVRIGDDREPSSIPKGTVDFLIAIGNSLPMLESLDLRTRWYGADTYFCSSSEPISPTVRDSLMVLLPFHVTDLGVRRFRNLLMQCHTSPTFELSSFPQAWRAQLIICSSELHYLNNHALP